ncbi:MULTISPECIES: LysR family transcriptional regulator [Streptomyces]|uniref:LysR family transcriptional regulator n=1 Tax=Streptomyces flaveolus TaxID=67297 RepID=A0ABV3A325_9ACTN|nr:MULTISPECIES: LysR family transcriptional regulator [Streptomyces]KMS88652.1 transcriptional regulator [Streptomyces regensis]KOG60928.1 transcriptional regulator [Streptomyces antibioticus]
MDLRQLRYLVAIAEEGNLRRAAESLYVTQPSLSYALKSLESELGVRLFDRHAGGVTATAAGRDIVAEARRTLRQADRVRVLAERHRQSGTQVLRVGFEASGAGELTTRARSEFARRRPGVRVEPKRFDWGEEVAALRDGRVDVAFVWLPADLTDLHSEVVHSEPRVVGFPRGHRLAARDGVTLTDVEDEPLTWTERAPRPWVDWWAVNPRPDGSPPRWGPTNDNVEEMLEQVASGEAICFAPAGMARYYARPDLAWVPLLGVEPMCVAMAWVRGTETDLVQGFADTVRGLVADTPPECPGGRP